MLVRQMKLPFNVKPTARVVPSRLVFEPPRGEVESGNKKASGGTLAEPILAVAGLPPLPAADAPPSAGSG